MKNIFKKFIVTILSLCFAVTSLCACQISIGGEPKNFLTFELTEKDLANYQSAIETGKNKLPTTSNVLEANSYLGSVINGFTYIVEQRYIAQILYFSDLTNEKYEKDYNFASTAFSTAREGYISLFKTVYNSNCPLKDQIFNGMTEKEINLTFNVPDEVTNLENQNTQLLDRYYALSDADFNTQTGLLYAQMVTNYQQIATLSGYDNYYEYASEHLYSRDYSLELLSDLTSYVKEYILPLYVKVVNRLRTSYATLTQAEQQLIYKIAYSPYNELNKNYLFEYISSLPTSAKDGMNDMFKNNNYLIATGENAREGAFTATMPYSEKPFCYFGPGYTDSFTIAHEVGHYYAISNNLSADIPLDVDEINSQANELLFLGFLQTKLSSNVFQTLELNSVADMLSTIIISTLMNEFEMRVFTSTSDLSNYASSDFDAVMNAVCEEFGSDIIYGYLTSDVNGYWKRAIVQQPIYYVSYSVSALSALGLYCEAVSVENGYDNAVSKYVNLCENADLSAGLLDILDEVGMLSPFNENTYLTLVAAFE